MDMRATSLLGLAFALGAQTAPDPTDVLLHARDKMVGRTNQSPNYTCVLLINRKYFKPSDLVKARSCDETIGYTHAGKDTGELESTDRVRLEVKISGGAEIGALPGAQFDSRDTSIYENIGNQADILDLARGNFESGTLGPVLQDIFMNDGAEFFYVGEKHVEGSTLLEYTFRVPAEVSHFLFRVGSSWLSGLSFEGSILIDSESFDLKSLTVRHSNLPPETRLCLATNTAEYQRVQIGSKNFLVPRTSVLRSVQTDSRVAETTIAYSSCREYHSESTIHFNASDEAPSRAVSQDRIPSSPLQLPAGLTFTVSFADPIDTDTAAAGDLIKAKLLQPVIDPTSKAVLAAADTIVYFRIIRMQHYVGSFFRIGVGLETLEIDGVERPVYARWNREVPTKSREPIGTTGSWNVIVLPPIGDSLNAAWFVFRTSKDRYLVPAGYKSSWITIQPPAQP